MKILKALEYFDFKLYNAELIRAGDITKHASNHPMHRYSAGKYTFIDIKDKDTGEIVTLRNVEVPVRLASLIIENKNFQLICLTPNDRFEKETKDNDTDTILVAAKNADETINEYRLVDAVGDMLTTCIDPVFRIMKYMQIAAIIFAAMIALTIILIPGSILLLIGAIAIQVIKRKMKKKLKSIINIYNTLPREANFTSEILVHLK